ncbi:MAG: hypothetical protein M3O31_00080 [Acidobacteriota bacterium]|nr:hypothetical protein [Acidobacteriota bacterium]
MTKSEIIALTLQNIEYRVNPPPEEIADCVGIEGYDDFVTATLVELLPSGNIESCKDFNELGVECCHTCPHLLSTFRYEAGDPAGRQQGLALRGSLVYSALEAWTARRDATVPCFSGYAMHPDPPRKREHQSCTNPHPEATSER